MTRRKKKEPTMADEQTTPDDEILEAFDDAKVEIDPAKAETTLSDMIALDHKLRDEGSSIVSLLTILAHTSQGLRV